MIYRGGLGVVPQKKFGLDGVKSCNLRQNKHGNDTFIKDRGTVTVYDGRRGYPLNLEVIRIFQIFTLLYDTGERSEPEKNIKIRWKQPFDPLSYPSNLHTRPHLWQISGGGGSGPPPPLWIRACDWRHIIHHWKGNSHSYEMIFPQDQKGR